MKLLELLEHYHSLDQRHGQANNNNNLNKSHKRVLYEWLYSVGKCYRLHPTTIFLSYSLLEYYTSRNTINTKYLQSLGIAALHLATVYRENLTTIDDCVGLCANTYTAEQIAQDGYRILACLNYNLELPSVLDFLYLYFDINKYDDYDETTLHNQIIDCYIEHGGAAYDMCLWLLSRYYVAIDIITPNRISATDYPLTDIEYENHRLKSIGSGTYGSVYRVKNIAIKVSKSYDDVPYPCSFLRETAGLMICRPCPHFVQILAIDIRKNQNIIAMQLCDTDLYDLIRSKYRNGMKPKHIKTILRDLLLGLEFIHQRGYCHRDLKPKNILINYQPKYTVKIADLGMMRRIVDDDRLNSQHSGNICTISYSAPEMLIDIHLGQRRQYTDRVDIWSLGCIACEMITGHYLFPADSNTGVLLQISRLLGPVPGLDLPTLQPTSWEHITKDKILLDLIRGMLCYDAEKRLSCHQALRHAYFRN